ncbi:MAG: binding--dependent transport system inner rane component family protein [Cypionkella sp.]|uniref:ABC transporter permease n=1 Tax=Cypionkella sp. TaxID=2811411 RepID=UPI002627E781|nr:ABC transporter permease [Cypionkella sp.]MDB5660924.1 binding--dependent transport system inner rane component family protein [Cypionkella sp.]
MTTVPHIFMKRPRWLTVPLGIGAAVVLFWLAATVLAPAISQYDPLELVGRRLQQPSWEHWLGTDALGRDVLSRTLHGARYSLPIAVIVVTIAVAVGALLGAVSGFVGGFIGAAIMRLVDVTLSFPPMLLAMAVAASLGPGLGNATVAMVIVWWPVYARLMRAQVLEVREREHVEAAVAAGAAAPRVLFKHILPLCWTPVLISATMDLGQVILLAASLSFIGLGATPPSPEWGSMISDGASQFYSWWVALGPGLAILSIVLGFNFIGDGLHDYFDPRSK